MFLGPGIKGNRVVGATDEGQFAVPLDPRKLACDKKAGIRIRPEHVHEALRQYASIAEHKHALQFPLGVKAEEQLQGLWAP
jgi:hypothetical protein